MPSIKSEERKKREYENRRRQQDEAKQRNVRCYGIERDRVDGPGYHYRSRGSVDDLLNSPPAPSGERGRRYPKSMQNKEGDYPRQRQYYEYPTKEYAYGNGATGQNARGHARWVNGQGTVVRQASPGFTRTITDREKKIQGVSYHPLGDREKLVRATEQRRNVSGNWMKKVDRQPKVRRWWQN